MTQLEVGNLLTFLFVAEKNALCNPLVVSQYLLQKAF